MFIKSLFVGIFCAGLAGTSMAAAGFSTGPTVSTPDRMATFDGLTSDDNSLANYSEGLLSITTNNVNYQGFNAFGSDPRTTAFYYTRSGDYTYTSVKGTDGAVLSSIDFLLGDGFGSSFTNLRFETFLNGVMTDSEIESNLAKGGTFGITDVNGFDEVRLAAGTAAILSDVDAFSPEKYPNATRAISRILS